MENKNKLIHDIKSIVKGNENKTYYFSTTYPPKVMLWKWEEKTLSTLKYLEVKKDVLYLCVEDKDGIDTDKLSDFDVEEVALVYDLVKDNR